MKHAHAAADSLELAMSGHDELANRERAMREVGRALALNPRQTEALHVCKRLLTELPKDSPEEVEVGLERYRVKMMNDVKHVSAWVYGIPLLFLPSLYWVEVHNWLALSVIMALSAATVLCGVLKGRPTVYRECLTSCFFMLSMATVGALSVVFSAYVLVPGIAAVSIMGQVIIHRKRRLWWATLCGCATFIVPLMMQWFGIIEPFMSFKHGAMTIHSSVFFLSGVMPELVLVVGNIAVVVGGALFAVKFRDRLVAYERRAQLTQWQLRQIVPRNERQNG